MGLRLLPPVQPEDDEEESADVVVWRVTKVCPITGKQLVGFKLIGKPKKKLIEDPWKNS